MSSSAGTARSATATIAYAEAHAAFARRRRAGDLSERQYASTCRQFEHEWGAWIHIGLDDDVLELARDLIRRHPLRGFDAIHLASALAFRTMLGEELTLAAADTGLLNAARGERLRALNVERPSGPAVPSAIARLRRPQRAAPRARDLSARGPRAGGLRVRDRGGSGT